MPKNVQITAQLHSTHASKVMLKILQVRPQQYMNRELPDVQAEFRNADFDFFFIFDFELEIKLPTSVGS